MRPNGDKKLPPRAPEGRGVGAHPLLLARVSDENAVAARLRGRGAGGGCRKGITLSEGPRGEETSLLRVRRYPWPTGAGAGLARPGPVLRTRWAPDRRIP